MTDSFLVSYSVLIFLGAGLDNTVFIWDTANGRNIYSRLYEFPMTLCYWIRMDDAEYPNYSLCMANVSSFFHMYFYLDNKMMKYAAETEKFNLPSTGYPRTYTTASYEPKTQVIYVGTTSGELFCFSLDKLLFKCSFPIINNGVNSLVLLDDGSFIAGGGDGKVKKLIIDNKGNCVLLKEVQLMGRIQGLSMTSDRKEIIAAVDNGKIFRILVSELDYTIHSVSPYACVNQCLYAEQNDIVYTCDDTVFII